MTCKRYHNTRQIQADFERILRILSYEEGFMVVIAFIFVSESLESDTEEEQREKRSHCTEKSLKER